MVSAEQNHVIAAILFTIPLVLILILLLKLRKYLPQISSKSIRINSLLCLTVFAAVLLLFVIWNVIEYISLTNSNINKNKLKEATKIILIPRISIGSLNWIFVGSFITLKLIISFNNTPFLSINKPIIITWYVIYVIAILFWHGMLLVVHSFSYWYPNFLNEPYRTLLTVSTITYSLISEIYFISIFILFNVKLYKFISLTMKNDETLSLEINSRLSNFIIKQTNLISVITIICAIFQVSAFLRWVTDVDNPRINLLYAILLTIQEITWTICIYLAFKFNDKYYYHYCKYNHQCCVYSCTKLIKSRTGHKSLNIKQDRNSNIQRNPNHRLLIQQERKQYQSVSTIELDIAMHTSQQYSTHNIDMGCNITNIDGCEAFQRLQDICRESAESYDNCDILNAFHHLLEEHDTDLDFGLIHDKLNEYRQCEYSNCEIYSRHYTRRRRFVGRVHNNSASFDEKKEEEKAQFSKRDILDKIHSFYYHSYDTNARIRVSQQCANDDDRISTIYKMIKSNNQNSNSQKLTTNKFSSDLQLKKTDDSKNDIYSFGQRFEYDDAASQWFVQPKYDKMKAEFIEHEVCNITINEYQIEYSKCIEYMQTNKVKLLENNDLNKKLNIDHILALLIYCNCDEYQRKWSETFRRLQSTELTETNESLKLRHSHFYYCSKNLRNLVEYFGSRLIDINNENKIFYHGVNRVLYLTRTITKFNGPLSTSAEPAVALNFSGPVGLVLALKYSSSTYLLHAKYFDCAFFSDFVNEKECLFVGGVPMMIITNIINVSNGFMYRKYINALNIINCILNGTLETDNVSNYEFTQDSIELCCSLIRHQLNNDGTDLPQYIVKLFNRYCINLNSIMVFWRHMNTVEKIKESLCNTVNELVFFDLNRLSQLFPNLEQIEYFNKLPKTQLKSTVKEIIDIISESNNFGNLKYVIIHHDISLPEYENIHSMVDLNSVGSKEWKLFQDNRKIILYCDVNESADLNSLNIKYNQINQAIASKTMIKNLL